MNRNKSRKRFRIVFISGNTTWGGSEELWSATAAELASEGHAVTVFKPGIDETEPRIRRLRELSCRIRDLARLPLVPRQITSMISFLSSPTRTGLQLVRLLFGLLFSPRPDLVIISQGGNQDGLYVASVCRFLEMPYVLIMQKATDLYWPNDSRRERMRAMYTGGLWCFFVSEHNRRLTEEQVGIELPNATVVRNPFLVPWEQRTDWPDERDGLRLACIARLYPMEKGQDLLLRVLARDKWRQRPLFVTFYGEGLNRAGVEEMARKHGLTSVSFAGFVREIASVWGDHHGLILPSRCEGLPLVIVEAMLSGRVSIVTNVGGSAEILDDGTTGFLAGAATEDSIDEAMERAWERRAEWREIGAAAATKIRSLVPQNPGEQMAGLILSIASQPAEASQQVQEHLRPA